MDATIEIQGLVGEEILDTVGLYCPVPIIRTAETMKRLNPGAVLEILSDDRVILIDMPAWCRSSGNEYIGSRQEGEEYRLYIRKSAAGKRFSRTGRRA